MIAAAAALALIAAAAPSGGAPPGDPVLASRPAPARPASGPVDIAQVCEDEPDKSMLADMAEILNEARELDRQLARPGRQRHSQKAAGTRAELLSRRRQLVEELTGFRDTHLASYSAQHCLARAFMSLKEHALAVAAAERAAELAPDSAETLSLRGMAYLLAGDRQRAARDAAQVLRRDPSNKGAADLYLRAAGRPFERPAPKKTP